MTTEAIDCHAILGLPGDATQAQISAAHRTLLRRHHPDPAPALATHASTCPAISAEVRIDGLVTRSELAGEVSTFLR